MTEGAAVRVALPETWRARFLKHTSRNVYALIQTRPAQLALLKVLCTLQKESIKESDDNIYIYIFAVAWGLLDSREFDIK